MTAPSNGENVVLKNRLIGRMPKVGIRPIIDGRRGVRDSLQGQTMALAETVADLFETHLRHPNGLPVECVIADTCIGGLAEASRAAEKFETEGVGMSVTVTPCWAYGAETMDTDPLIPKAIWGFNGSERPGAVYLAATAAAHDQKGLPVFKVYGRHVRDADDTSIPQEIQQELLQIAKAGLAVARMRRKAYLSIGNVSMGIAGSIVDHGFFESYLGMRVMTVDMSEFSRRLGEEVYDTQEFERALAWVRENCQEGKDHNPPEGQRSREQKDGDWKTVVKMAMIARDLMIGNAKLGELGYEEEALGHSAIAAGFQGQRQWTDHLPNGDFMEAILNSSFDWDGIRQPFIMATENDCLNGVSMLFGHLLTNTPQIFADVRTFWSPDAVKRVTGYEMTGRKEHGIIHLINSGSATLDATGKMTSDGKPAMKPFWEITPEDVEACLKATTWHPASVEYFRGGGFSSQFVTAGGMPVTMSRLNIVHGLGPVLQIAEGWTVDLPDEVHSKLNHRTDPAWPTHWFVPNLTGSGPFQDVYSVMKNWGANHGAISYGHIGSRLITLASMLRIPVSMHNVPAERICRPSCWAAFGGTETYSADFRACQALGPLYGSY